MRTVWVVSLVLLMLVSTAFAGSPAPTVATDRGRVSGIGEDGMRVFRGIPYAAPPVGPLRWRPPQPARSWTGVRQCTRFGPSCPQPASRMLAAGPQSEDCLYLNVWAPPAVPGSPRPVMVWIHGGSLIRGSGNQKVSDGTALARNGVVVVSLNYRLGPLGFLALPALTAEDGNCGNYGLLDQVAALQWVHHNIAAFGGDPGNVTIFGESAGAASVCCLMVSPAAHGLFQRAIAESGTAEYLTNPRQQVEHDDASLVQRWGTDGTLAALRAVPAETLVASTRLGWHADFAIGGFGLPVPPRQAFASGSVADVPLLLGTNADEGTLFGNQGVRTADQYEARLARVFAADVPTAQRLFGLHPGANVRRAVAHLVTLVWFTAPARRIAQELSRRHHVVYLYHFSRIRAGPFGDLLGATHGAELPYVFGTLDRGADAVDRQLSATMRETWVRFAVSGNPNHHPLPTWPAYTTTNDSSLEFDDPIQVRRGLLKPECDLVGRIRMNGHSLSTRP